MKVAVEGCCHGELDNIYHTIETARTQAGIETPDVLICCGDFQSFRNNSDLQTFAAPPKYRQLGSFWKYYNGEKLAPILTIFIGGNHEASGYLWELYHGGWVAPNIYFLGFAGSVILKKTLFDGTIDSIRISGASGIFKKHDYCFGHYERLPYDNGTIRSIYHVREYDIFRLSLLPMSSSSDIFVSHDWPVGIEQYGNTAQLLRAKPFFRDEVASNTLGSPPLMHLLKTIKPHYWFSAHLHVKFAALYHHDFHAKNHQPITKPKVALNPDELQIDLHDHDDQKKSSPASLKPSLINPDMIVIDDSDNEEMALNEALADHSTYIQPLKNERNLDELQINFNDDKDEKRPSGASLELPPVNPDMIPIDISDDDEMNVEKALTDQSRPQTQSSINVSSETDAVHLGRRENLRHPASIQEIGKDAAATRESTTTRVLDPINPSTDTTPRITRFLALDKCVPRKDFLQILDINVSIPIARPSSVLEKATLNSTEDKVLLNSDVNTNQDGMNDGKATLFFDPHWLAITRAFHSYMPLQKHGNPKLPSASETSSLVKQELEWVKQNIATESLEINQVQQFIKTAPGIGDPGGENTGQPLWYTNPQTLALTELLGIQNKINPSI